MLEKLSIALWVLIVLNCTVDAAKLPPLPKWNAEDREKIKEGKLIVGVALLTKDGLKKKEETKEVQKVEVIIEAAAEKPSLDTHDNLEEDSEISGDHLEHYFAKRPESSLVDPQQLLSMQERADLQYVLELHSSESDLPIYVYLFDKAQKVPEAYFPEKVYQQTYTGNEVPLVIVYYYIGAPERSDFLLAGGASDQVPDWQVRELLWNAAHKAREKFDVFDQLEGFVGQLSMRLFWIEEILRELIVVIPAVEEVLEPVKKSSKPQQIIKIVDEAMTPELSKALLFTILGSVMALVAGICFMQRKLHFPKNPTPPRMGGARGAKSGGILSYSNPRVSPSMQREQFEKNFF